MFLDSGDPSETKEVIDFLGFLNGQTTNPTLVSKHPLIKERSEKEQKFTPKEIMDFYKKVVTDISILLPDGSVSIEVYADKDTMHEEMIAQAHAMYAWIPNAHIKLPTTYEGLLAAETLVQDGLRVNMTLCFTEEQAAAVYAATKGAKKGQVFVSPFIGRLDDTGVNGMDLIKNIVALYKKGDGHVEVLAASIRTMEHMYAASFFGADIITAPMRLLKEWSLKSKDIPLDFTYQTALAPIPYHDCDLHADWKTVDILHPLTDKGLASFSSDWNALII